MALRLFVITLLPLIFISCSVAPVSPTLTPAISTATPSSVYTPIPGLGLRTKTSGCVAIDGLPDASCTPGSVFRNVTTAQVCVIGYSATVRNVYLSEKSAVYAAYGITSHFLGQYEVDHLIPLELGGDNSLANLWPQAAFPTPGFHEKDVLENHLRADVCANRLALSAAQVEIATNWLAFTGP